MKLQFKQQQFQLDAVKAVVDCFAGQRFLQAQFTLERTNNLLHAKKLKQLHGQQAQATLYEPEPEDGFSNSRLEIAENELLGNIQKVQGGNNLHESQQLIRPEGTSKSTRLKYNLSVEMETGTGKTYTYIRTMYELHKKYGWSKFIVIVPSVAIREGVYKSFQVTQEHFQAVYGKKISPFIYNSSRLQEIESFASDSRISVMIINTQAFNARGKDARRIYQVLDAFGSRKPIDVIAQTRPILIIDEPQSVDGKKTLESMEGFRPLFSLRYSATHKQDYNKIYRLDALDAYQKKLVKQIQVKGISLRGSTGTSGYIYLESVEYSKKAPVAWVEFEKRASEGVKRVRQKLQQGDSLFSLSGEMPAYKDVVIRDIDGAKGEVDFGTNILQPGDTLNHASEKDFRRIQIRECIKSHLEKEKNLFGKGIKVLSLFFIDSVEKYRAYNPTGEEVLGEYAQIFEEEYRNLRNNSLSLFTAEYNEYMVQTDPTAVHKAYFPKESYQGYLERDDAEKVHSGYFSIDKKGRAVDPKLKRNLEDSDDVSAYDLIMKDKERLLSFEEPVRFIFSHSALKEGWDNPNVFQICALKNVEGGSQARRRQEVGRGMRLCVNKEGIRQDFQLVGEQVHEINKLTVVASESYEQFAKGLQSEIAETLKDRPQKADKKYFVGKVLTDKNNQEIRIDDELAQDLFLELFSKKVVDKKGEITPEGRGMIEKGEIPLPENLKPYQASICGLLKQIYTGEGMMPSNERNQVVLVPNQNFDRKDFQELWNKINLKTIYEVRFNSEELIKEGVRFINGQLKIADRTYELRSGSLKQGTIEEMREGTLMADSERETIKFRTNLQTEAVYDLIGELESRTQLTRHSLAQILKNIKEEKFLLFRKNPEEFISKCSRLINEAKSSLIVKEIIYHKTEERFDAKDVFTNDKSMLRTGNVLNKHIYDFLTTDSKVEAEFAHALEASKEVVVYAKLPRGFYITTPVAKYSPDWAIVFDQNEVKEIYFVVETKGSEKEEDLRGIEHFKIECAKKHFEVIDNINLKFVKKASYESLKEELSFVGEG